MFGFGSSTTRFDFETYLFRGSANDASILKVWGEIANEICSYGYKMKQANNVLEFSNQEKKVGAFYVALSTKLGRQAVKLTGDLPASDGKRLRRFLGKQPALELAKP